MIFEKLISSHLPAGVTARCLASTGYSLDFTSVSDGENVQLSPNSGLLSPSNVLYPIREKIVPCTIAI